VLDLDLAVDRPGFRVEAKAALPLAGISAVIGRSGSGKSTLLLALAGLLRPSRGHLRLNGRTLYDAAAGIDLPPERRALGVVFQEGRLFPHLNVRHNLLYGATRAARRALPAGGPRFDDVVALLGIATLLARRPHTLSGGERQRVAIGRALLAQPQALLMDEPLASLDPARRHELLGYLAELPRHFALPIVYVTHQMDEVLRLAEHVVVMSEGRTVASGAALELLSDLSLQPLVGRFEAGSVLAGSVVEQLEAWSLSVIAVAGQRVTVPHIDAPPGAQVRLRVRARDVALQPAVLASSASNQLAGNVLRVLERDGAYAAVELALRPDALPGERLWALVTRRSVHALGIAPGQRLVGSFKAVAVEGRATARHDESVVR
jgi:molybdate transport system ATP-binding protein